MGFAKITFAQRLCALVKSAAREGPNLFHFATLVRINLSKGQAKVLGLDEPGRSLECSIASRDLISKKA